MKCKNINKLFTIICTISYFKYLLMKNSLIVTLRFVNGNICIEGDRNGSKSSCGRVLHSHTWMPYSA
jgi:hypothetical protein